MKSMTGYQGAFVNHSQIQLYNNNIEILIYTGGSTMVFKCRLLKNRFDAS